MRTVALNQQQERVVVEQWHRGYYVDSGEGQLGRLNGSIECLDALGGSERSWLTMRT